MASVRRCLARSRTAPHARSRSADPRPKQVALLPARPARPLPGRTMWGPFRWRGCSDARHATQREAPASRVATSPSSRRRRAPRRARARSGAATGARARRTAHGGTAAVDARDVLVHPRPRAPVEGHAEAVAITPPGSSSRAIAPRSRMPAEPFSAAAQGAWPAPSPWWCDTAPPASTMACIAAVLMRRHCPRGSAARMPRAVPKLRRAHGRQATRAARAPDMCRTCARRAGAVRPSIPVTCCDGKRIAAVSDDGTVSPWLESRRRLNRAQSR